MVATEILAARVGPGATGRDGTPFLAELRAIVTAETTAVGFHLDTTSAAARRTNGHAVASPLPTDLARLLTDAELTALESRRRPTTPEELDALAGRVDEFAAHLPEVEPPVDRALAERVTANLRVLIAHARDRNGEARALARAVVGLVVDGDATPTALAAGARVASVVATHLGRGDLRGQLDDH
jgi:hypothetical protein